jgi:DNA-binding PadR family transcriptional regulator
MIEANTRHNRSAWGLTILSLLRERPMHPYEMRRLIRERGKDQLMDLRAGSLYRAIERLDKARLIQPVETSREGRFPERTVYRITENGLDELDDWMRELLSRPVKDYPRLVDALSFLAVLTPDDARARLEERCVILEAEIAALDSVLKQLHGSIPRLFVVEEEYARAMRKAELQWVRALVDDLRSGSLTWDLDELARQYSRPPQLPPSKLTIVEGGEPT